MLLKDLRNLRNGSVLLLLLSLTSVGANLSEYCAECEQEIWEEVPCSEIPISSTTAYPTTTGTSTTPRIITEPSPPTSTPPPTTVVYQYVTTTPLPDLPVAQMNESKTFRKCYCECKLGCKEFCRKVESSGPNQQITQLTSTAEQAPGAHIEYTHVHQRKVYPVIPEPYPTKAALPYPLERQQAYNKHSIPADSGPGYSIDELTGLLDAEYATKKEFENPSSVYYAPYEFSPIYSKVAVDPALSSRQADSNTETELEQANYISKHTERTNCTSASSTYGGSEYYPTPSNTSIEKPASLDHAINNYIKNYIYHGPSP